MKFHLLPVLGLGATEFHHCRARLFKPICPQSSSLKSEVKRPCLQQGDQVTPMLNSEKPRCPAVALALAPAQGPPHCPCRNSYTQQGVGSAAHTGSARSCPPHSTLPRVVSSTPPHSQRHQALPTGPASSPRCHPAQSLTIKGHILYEAHVQGQSLSQGHKVQEFVVVQASHHHTVHLAGNNRTPWAVPSALFGRGMG